jgi:glyoxylase-like metal-dependent hydrolase (beta-lactamase superfamily II)
MRISRLRLGGFDVYGLQDGFLYLDGGAMFGVVPKTLWQEKIPANRKNQIKLSLNSLLIKTKKALILVETGLGSKLSPKYLDIYTSHWEPRLLDSLHRLGVKTEDIHLVINTHLHFDHCGWNTVKNEKGMVQPTFPKAKYIFQKGEWEDALQPNERDKPSYLSENFLTLKEYGLVQLVEGDTEISEGVKVIWTPGHTAHHQCVKIQSHGHTLFFLGDLVPTSAHIRVPYLMSYDLFPLDTMKSKKKCYEQGLQEDWTYAFVHDSHHYFGKIQKIKDKYEFLSLENLVV